MENLQIVPDLRRIETNLIFKVFRDTRNKISKSRIYYSCVDSDCKAKLTTNISKNSIIPFDEYPIINLLPKTNCENYLSKYFENTQQKA